MDFLDPQKQKRHARRLAIGYALIGLALILATTILVYGAYGFGIDRNGKVIQNGLVFFSSHPSGADIYVSGQPYNVQTNARLVLPAGQYTVELRRPGYTNWKRAVTAEGGVVERFDYPFLFPSKLVTTVTKQYATAPGLATQSPDRRWLLLQAGGNLNELELYDFGAAQPVAKAQSVPVEALSAGTTTIGWQAVEWSSDNRHVVLRRLYQKNSQPSSEYILYDRQDPTLSQNLSVMLGFTPTTLALRNLAYDQYYAFDQNNGQLFTATLKKPTPQVYLSGVLAFASDRDTVLYATADSAPATKVLMRIKHADDPAYTLRQTAADKTYLLDIARYGDVPYVEVGSPTENKVYVYKDPLSTLQASAKAALVPVQVLKVTGANYVSFSPNARFAMAESGTHFAVYDAETDKAYAYDAKSTLDAPQLHAGWMDGFRLELVSGGKLQVFEFDSANARQLGLASPAYLPFFDHAYKYGYMLTPQNALTSTALLAPGDL